MKTVSIIGTAGRKLDKYKMTSKLYDKMLLEAKNIIQKTFKLDPAKVILVSGGAAWSDHIAVDLYLQKFVTRAKLYLPCDWDFKNKKHLENNSSFDPGKAANYYHEYFSQKLKRNTLGDIDTAITQGLEIDTKYKGFKTRNNQVALSDYIIAFTWSITSEPNDGGTKDTWDKSNSKFKVHVNMDKL
jgi:hypothetical protein